jgi:hypothetical protein
MRETSVSAVAALVVATGPLFAKAERDEETVVGVQAVLGIEALAHNENYCRKNHRHSDTAETADFERGLRPGVRCWARQAFQSSVLPAGVYGGKTK